MPSDDTIHNLLDFLFGRKQLRKVTEGPAAPAAPAATPTAQTDLAKAIAANPNNTPKPVDPLKVLGAPAKKKKSPVMLPTAGDGWEGR